MLAAGFAAGWAEHAFYGTIDENGVVQESFFLPLSYIFLFLGAVMSCVAIGFWMGKAMIKRRFQRLDR